MTYKNKFAIVFLIYLSFASAGFRGLQESVIRNSLAPTKTTKWFPDTPYVIGNVVNYNGANYKCIQPHTSLIEWAPNTTPALWQITATTCAAVPSAPTGLGASSTTSSSTTLQWAAVAAPSGCNIIGYTIFQNGVAIYTGVTGTAYTVLGLAPSTSYKFAVAAIDSAGNSPRSSSVSVTTAAASSKPSGPKPTPAPQPAPTPVPTPSSGKSSGLIFAPYIDMSLANNNLSAISAKTGVKKFTLAFITGSGCTPTWFGQYTIPGENNIKSIISSFGSDNVIISFGGAVGHELAHSCGNLAGTLAGYQAVIDYYGVKNLDFDIEGVGLGRPDIVDIRNQAIAQLQAANPGLTVSYTLPVLPSGLTYDGINLMKSSKKFGVKVDVLNLMTMDYGPQFNPNTMGQNAIDAVKNTVAQLAKEGITPKMGIIPMIGVNDVNPEVFTFEDAKMVLNYAKTEKNVARLSMWSIARDNGGCPGSLSYGCSGVTQNEFDFAKIFNKV